MRTRAELLGHPIHQMLIVFPLGLLGGAVLFDIAHLATSSARFADVAYWCIAGGTLSGIVAAIFGVVDWTGIPAGTRAWRIGALHGVGNVIVVLLAATSWFLRSDNPPAPGAGAFAALWLGVGLSVVTGWLGGELVDRLAIGVHEGAHADSPSSLSGRPASENAAASAAGSDSDRPWAEIAGRAAGVTDRGERLGDQAPDLRSPAHAREREAPPT